MGDLVLSTPAAPGSPGAQASWQDIDTINTGPWIDISGDLVGLWNHASSTAWYRVVGDRVEVRGLVRASGASVDISGGENVFSNFPDEGGSIPAGLLPGIANVSFPGIYYQPGGTPYPGLLSANTKFTAQSTAGTGVSTTADFVQLDGISWSTTA